MKKIAFLFVLLVSFSSCKQDEKTKSNAMEDNVSLPAHKENTEVQATDDPSDYAELGLEYALNAQTVLGKNLMQAIQKEGTLGALTFCNEQAYPLTDSMAVVQNVKLKRVSDQPRNENNQANAEELKHIESYKNNVVNQELPEPIVAESDTEVRVYYPILTNGMCLQCHGKPSNMEPSTLKELTVLYPKDKALGYDVNEVRGIWKVTFDKN